LITIEEVVQNQLLYNPVYREKVISYIREEYFSNMVKGEVFKRFLIHTTKYGTPPSFKELYISLEKNSNFSEDEFNYLKKYFVNCLTKAGEYQFDWLMEETEKFIQDREIFLTLQKTIRLYESGGPEKNDIPDLFRKALSVSLNTVIGTDYTEDVQQRYSWYNSEEELIRFDLSKLNELTDGGVLRKTLNLLLGMTNSFKSGTMIHFGSSYLMNGYNVLYVSLELSEKAIANRFDANLYGMTTKDVKGMSLNDMISRISQIKNRTKGKLIIKEFPTSTINVGHIRQLLHELKLKKGFIPDVIIVDSVDLMLSVRNSVGASEFSYLKYCSQELRGLFVEHNVAGWSPVQTNRQGYNSTDLSLGDTGGSYALNSIADYVLGIMRTEDLDKQNKILFKELKTRYGNNAETSRSFTALVDIGRMKLYDDQSLLDRDRIRNRML